MLSQLEPVRNLVLGKVGQAAGCLFVASWKLDIMSV
jgi:hypothetical protein